MRGFGEIQKIGLSILAVTLFATSARADDAKAQAEQAKALNALVAKCAYRVHANIFQSQAKLKISGARATGPTYHDTEIEMTSRAGAGQMFVTGPSGRDFGMIEVGETGFGFGRPQFQIHDLGGTEGELKAIKFDGMGQFAIGVFESPLSVENPSGPKALVLVPLHVTDNETGAMAPLSASIFALPIEGGASKVKIWAQEGSHRFFMTDSSNSFSILEITEAGELKRTGMFKFEPKGDSPLTDLKINQVSFLSDGETAMVHFQFGKDQKNAIAMAKVPAGETGGGLQISFGTSVVLRDGASRPLSIAVQPYTDLIYINFESGYDILSPVGESLTVNSVGTFEHPTAGVKSINFHWGFVSENQIVVTPTFVVPVDGQKKSQIYWGEARLFNVPGSEPEPKEVEPIVHEGGEKRETAHKKPRVVLKVDKPDDGASEAPAELGNPPADGDGLGE